MNIYEKIAAIMQDVQYLAKDDHVSFGSTNYKALSEEKVTSIMRAEMLKHKLVVFPVSQIANRTGNIAHVDVVYRMVNVENPRGIHRNRILRRRCRHPGQGELQGHDLRL